MAPEIRPAVPEEFPAVADVCVAAYAPFLGGDHRYLDVLRDVPGRAAAAEVLVAADLGDGNVLGTVTFVPGGGPLGEIAAPSEAEFRMLAVDPAAQGRGLGGTLLERVLDDGRRRGKAGSSARVCRRCAPPTPSTGASASAVRPSATGRRSTVSTCSRSCARSARPEPARRVTSRGRRRA